MAHSTQLFLVCHAPLGSALHAVACHGFGQKLSDVIVLDVLSSQTPQQVADALAQLWQEHGKPSEVLVITDLLGATPANGAQLWLKQLKTLAEVHGLGLAGVSLPGLLRALTYRELPARELVDKLLQDPGQGCCSLMQDEDIPA
jgi:PTS system ascorbate-specific IIA component